MYVSLLPFYRWRNWGFVFEKVNLLKNHTQTFPYTSQAVDFETPMTTNVLFNQITQELPSILFLPHKF